MTRRRFQREGVEFAGLDIGEGPGVVFQHGLGGDEAQVAQAFPEGAYRRLTLECRAQGASTAGDPARFSLAAFTDDVLAFAELCGLERFVVGGISMGAALALRIAVLHPDRVNGLILARPAWGWDRAPGNMRPFAEVARHLLASDREGFEATPIARQLALEAPDNLASLRGFFDRPDPEMTARLLEAIANDGPGVSEAEVRAIRAPALVLGNSVDYVHPLARARALADAVPNARFAEITPKAIDPLRHFAEFRAEVARFLSQECSPK